MKTILIFSLLIAYSEGIFFKHNRNSNFIKTSFPQKGNSMPERRSFVQKLNHNQPTDNRTWIQSYWVEKKFNEKNLLVYLLLAGEESADPAWLYVSYWSSHGQDNGAILMIMEHRFYGMSRPTNNVSTENLKYLTAELALGDIAYFITEMKTVHNLSEETKWIVFGGSYAGSLAAWARLKYPHLIHAAVASSAPLLAKLDFYEYYENVELSLSQYNTKCAQDIATANEVLRKMVMTKAGRLVIGKIFRLCNPLSNRRKDWSYLFAQFASLFGFTVQYNENTTDSSANIAVACNEMLKNQSRQPVILRYANTIHVIMEKTGETCLETRYSRLIESLRKSDWASSDDRQWLYQTCTEFGFFPTSSKANDTFGPFLSINFFVNLCSDIFGPEFNERLISYGVNRTNIIYGERNIKVGNIIFIKCSSDPWHSLGVNTDEDEDYVVIDIPGASHCQDMQPPNSADSEDLQNGRALILAMLDSYIQS